MRSFAAQVRDEADATRIVFVRGIVESLRGRRNVDERRRLHADSRWPIVDGARHDCTLAQRAGHSAHGQYRLRLHLQITNDIESLKYKRLCGHTRTAAERQLLITDEHRHCTNRHGLWSKEARGSHHERSEGSRSWEPRWNEWRESNEKCTTTPALPSAIARECPRTSRSCQCSSVICPCSSVIGSLYTCLPNGLDAPHDQQMRLALLLTLPALASAQVPAAGPNSRRPFRPTSTATRSSAPASIVMKDGKVIARLRRRLRRSRRQRRVDRANDLPLGIDHENAHRDLHHAAPRSRQALARRQDRALGARAARRCTTRTA